MFLRQMIWVLFASVLTMLMPSSLVQAASSQEIDAKVQGALKTLYQQSPAAKDLAAKAVGLLVFPEIYKGGFVVGGAYGEGALMSGSQIVDYYSTASGSVGFQFGVQRRAEVIMFMTQESFNAFKLSEGWQAGVDGSIAIATLGAGGSIDSETLKRPIIGFIFSNQGLMYNLTFEGSKFTKIAR